MDVVLRARLIQVLVLIIADLFVIGSIITCRNQSQIDVFFEHKEVKDALVSFITCFRITMMILITYSLVLLVDRVGTLFLRSF